MISLQRARLRAYFAMARKGIAEARHYRALELWDISEPAIADARAWRRMAHKVLREMNDLSLAPWMTTGPRT